MSKRRFVRSLGSLATALLLFAQSARADLTPWDQARVTALAKELTAAADALNDTFLKQAPPSVGSMQSSAYLRLKQLVRLMRTEANQLAESVGKGEGREETLPIYENLMQLTRSARDEADKVFVARDVGARASAVRGVLNQLGPYYDPDFPVLAPRPNIEPGATR